MISCEVQFQQPILQSKNLIECLLKWDRRIQASETKNYSSVNILGQFFILLHTGSWPIFISHKVRNKPIIKSLDEASYSEWFELLGVYFCTNIF